MNEQKQSERSRSGRGTLPLSGSDGASPTLSDFRLMAEAMQAQARAIEALVNQNATLLAMLNQMPEEQDGEGEEQPALGYDLAGNRIKAT